MVQGRRIYVTEKGLIGPVPDVAKTGEIVSVISERPLHLCSEMAAILARMP